MKKIKGILIDSESKTVKEVEFENSLTSYYELIDCECVTTVLYDNQHDVILDDEGLLKSPIKGFFEIGEGLYCLSFAFYNKIAQATRFTNTDTEKPTIRSGACIAYKETTRKCVNLVFIQESHNPKGINRMRVEIAQIGMLLYKFLHDVVHWIAL